jgi:hypothetical protein
MKQCIVVLRHLPGNQKVVSAVIAEPEDKSNIDHMEGYLESRADDHIRDFKKKFVEFNSAEWFKEIHQLE